MPQFETTFYVSQIVWILISFLILYLIVHAFIFPMLADTINDRARQAEEDLALADRVNHQAQKNEQAYEQALLDAREEAAQLALKTQAKIIAFKKRNAAFIQKTTRHTFENAERQLEKEHALLLRKKARPIHKLAEDLATRFIKEG